MLLRQSHKQIKSSYYALSSFSVFILYAEEPISIEFLLQFDEQPLYQLTCDKGEWTNNIVVEYNFFHSNNRLRTVLFRHNRRFCDCFLVSEASLRHSDSSDCYRITFDCGLLPKQFMRHVYEHEPWRTRDEGIQLSMMWNIETRGISILLHVVSATL